MGVVDRRARERADLSDAALDAVERIAAEEGWDAVTIRRISDEVEWGAPKLYSLFGSKAGLASAARERAFDGLLNALESVRATSPHARLVAMADAHWRFATENPTRFQLMHGLAPAPQLSLNDAHTIPSALASFELLAEAVAAASDPPRDPDQTLVDARLLWATIFGIVALHLSGQLPDEGEGPRLTRQAVEQITLGRRAN